jgi:hypothetical protein
LKVDGENGKLEFDLKIDSQNNPRAVFIGQGQQHPDTNPFTLPAVPSRTK